MGEQPLRHLRTLLDQGAPCASMQPIPQTAFLLPPEATLQKTVVDGTVPAVVVPAAGQVRDLLTKANTIVEAPRRGEGIEPG